MATFSGVSINKAGTGYTLTATSSGLTSATSTAFNVTVGAAAKLAFGTQPSATAGGVAIPTFTVLVQDAGGNTVTASTAAITIAIGTNPSGGALSGTLTHAAVAGVATFSGVSIDKAGTAYTLTATSSGLTSATSTAFNVTVGATGKLAFGTQPSATTAGVAIPDFTVQVEDAGGNLITASTASITIAIGNNPSGGALSGTLTHAAVAGVATFSGVSINKAGNPYTLTATSSGLASATSTAFNITAGAATHLVFTVQPTNATAGAPIAPAVTVKAEDALGNVDTTYANPVGLSIKATTGTAGAVLTGGTAVAAVAGVATYSVLSINLAGAGYVLTAGDGTLSVDSSAFNIAAGAATQLVFTVQPTNATAGTAIAPAVTVKAEDALGNVSTTYARTIALTIKATTGTPGAVLTGVAAVFAVGGVATFGALSINLAGAGYVLTASDGTLSAGSSAFNITAGAATHLVFTVQPTNATAGAAIAPAVTVKAEDALGNVDTTYAKPVGLSIKATTGTAGAVLTGGTAVAAVAGVATFGALSINLAGTGYVLTAGDGTLSLDSSAFSIAAGAATHLVFTVQPANAVPGTIMAPVTVKAEDALGNVDTTYAKPVGLSIKASTGTAGAALVGGTAVAAVAGAVTFNSLSINLAGAGYVLTASDGTLNVDSTAFTIAAGVATHLVFTVQPTNATAGTAIAPAVTVKAEDALGNVNTTYTGNVGLVITTATGTGGAVLTGGAAVPAVAGVATFSGLSINLVGTSYTLTASSIGLTSASSSPFNITADAATHLVFTVQPANAVAGTPIAPAVTVKAEDAFSNVNTTYTGNVGLVITSGTGTLGAVLTGVTAVPAVAGVATFNGLSITLAGTGYTLTASSVGLTSATSGPFNITAGAATHLVFTVQPANAVAGTPIAPAVTVKAEDAFGNVNPTYTGNVGLVITSGTGTGGAVLTGGAAVPAVAGVATFSGLFINLAGASYTLTASSVGLTSATSGPFSITAGAATHLVFSVQPTSAAPGATMPAVAVNALDAFGNLDSTFTGNIGLAITSGTGTVGAVLTGGTAVPRGRRCGDFQRPLHQSGGHRLLSDSYQ